MKSLKELYRIGPGPSSSHTLGPQRAALWFKQQYPSASHFEVELFGSLSLTGKGHLTDYIIIKTFQPLPCEVYFKSRNDLKHPNTMRFIAYDDCNNPLGEATIYSVGGGAILIEGQKSLSAGSVYPHHSLKEIMDYCESNHVNFAQYVDEFDELDQYMDDILNQMIATVNGGLEKDGVLPGKLELSRIAKDLHAKALVCERESEKEKLLLCAYAYAASEENASGSMTVTAPTLGSSGIMPSLVYYFLNDLGYERTRVKDALKVAGLFGNLIKHNATISGAQGGCQAEVGAAVAMGAAFCATLWELSLAQVEYAAEIGIEHHLGLTCDPVGGYVMIPCIERNAVSVLRALDAAIVARYISDLREHRVTFDMVVNTMNYTGKKIPLELRETSLGGLASVVPLRR